MATYTLTALQMGLVRRPSPELLEGIPESAWPLLMHGADIADFGVFFLLRQLETTRKKHFKRHKTLSPKAYMKYLEEVELDWYVYGGNVSRAIDSWPPDLFDTAFPGVREERDRLVARRKARWGEVAP